VSLSSGDEVPHIFTRKSRLRPKEFLISGAKRLLQNPPFMHVLPAGFHRIRYYGLLASGKRAENIDRARELLKLPVLPVDAIKAANTTADEPQTAKHTCPHCGGRMIIIERFERGSTPRHQPTPPTPVIKIDTS